jgi:hypothetical protein
LKNIVDRFSIISEGGRACECSLNLTISIKITVADGREKDISFSP